MNEQEEYEFHNSGVAPLEILQTLKSSIERVCKEGDTEGARRILGALRHYKGLWHRSEDVTALYASAATTLLFAYANASKKEQCEELLQEMQNDQGARGEPLFDADMLKQALSHMHRM